MRTSTSNFRVKRRSLEKEARQNEVHSFRAETSELSDLLSLRSCSRARTGPYSGSRLFYLEMRPRQLPTAAC